MCFVGLLWGCEDRGSENGRGAWMELSCFAWAAMSADVSKWPDGVSVEVFVGRVLDGESAVRMDGECPQVAKEGHRRVQNIVSVCASSL